MSDLRDFDAEFQTSLREVMAERDSSIFRHLPRNDRWVGGSMVVPINFGADAPAPDSALGILREPYRDNDEFPTAALRAELEERDSRMVQAERQEWLSRFQADAERAVERELASAYRRARWYRRASGGISSLLNESVRLYVRLQLGVRAGLDEGVLLRLRQEGEAVDLRLNQVLQRYDMRYVDDARYVAESCLRCIFAWEEGYRQRNPEPGTPA